MAGGCKVSNLILHLYYIVVLLLTVCTGDRITDKIYEKLDANFSCFRRLNGTHQIGCSSPQSGSVGVVHYASNIQSLLWLVESGPHAPYVVVVQPDLFRRDNLMTLKDSGKISGVVVLNNTVSTSKTDPIPSPPYSNDLSCPNKFSSLYQNEDYSSYCDQSPWNEGGDGLLFEDLPFPIFFIDETSKNHSTLLNDCYFKFNHPKNGTAPSYPLCAIELKAFMWAAVDTPTCLRRGRLNMLLNPQPSEYCDPLGSVNIYLPVLAVNKNEKVYRNRSVIVISARIDSSSMFDGLAVGADTSITGMTTLIALSELLHTIHPIIENSDIDNVYLILFNGEAFDYIGSSRMVYDITKGMFPKPLNDTNPSQSPLLALEHIKYWIELGSLAPHSSNSVFIHTDPLSKKNTAVSTQIDELINVLKLNNNNLKVEVVQGSKPLPPASVQSFLKKDLEIPAIFIGNHRKSFTNKYYNSEWDTFSTISSTSLSKHLAAITRTIAGTVYQLASGGSMPSNFTANLTLIENILECYLINSNCTLFNWLLSGRNNVATGTILPTYVGVTHGDDNYKPLIIRTRHLLAYVSGQILTVNKTSCVGEENDELYQYYWLGESDSNNSSGSCYRSTVKTSPAVSPAFIIEDYDWKSSEYSSWTESRWESFSVRIFLKASPTQEISVFIFGIIVLLMSFFITYWLDIKSDTLFQFSSQEPVCC